MLTQVGLTSVDPESFLLLGGGISKVQLADRSTRVLRETLHQLTPFEPGMLVLEALVRMLGTTDWPVMP